VNLISEFKEAIKMNTVIGQEVYTLDYQEYEYQEQRAALANKVVCETSMEMDVVERYAWVDERLEQMCEEHCESASDIYDLGKIEADISMDVVDEDTDDVIVLNKNEYTLLNKKQYPNDNYYDYISYCEEEEDVIPMDIDDEPPLPVCRKLFYIDDDDYDDFDEFDSESDLLSVLSDVHIYPLDEHDELMLPMSPEMVRSNTIIAVLEDGTNIYNGNPNGSRFYDNGDDELEIIT
jgi:hypothetical protein